MNTRRISLDFGFLSIQEEEDGILHTTIRESVLLELENIEEVMQFMDQNASGRRFLNLFEFEEGADVDHMVRLWASNPSANNYGIADAIVHKTFPQKMVAEFYLKNYTRVLPTRIFDDLEDARAWLLTQKV